MDASGQRGLVGVPQAAVMGVEPFDRDFEGETGIEAGRSWV